jgi:hypothetical protein
MSIFRKVQNIYLSISNYTKRVPKKQATYGIKSDFVIIHRNIIISGSKNTPSPLVFPKMGRGCSLYAQITA